MLYAPGPGTGVFIGLDGKTGAADYALLDEITSTGIAPDAPDTPQSDPTMSLYAGARAARTTPGRPGTATYGFNPSDAQAAWQDLARLRGTADTRTIREEQGRIKEIVGTAAITGTVANGVLTLTGAGTTNLDLQDDVNWKEGMIVTIGALTDAWVIEAFTDTLKAEVRDAGTVNGNIVTPESNFRAPQAGASGAVKAHEYAVRRTYQASLDTLSGDATATGRTATVVFRMTGFARSTFLLADAVRTKPLPS